MDTERSTGGAGRARSGASSTRPQEQSSPGTTEAATSASTASTQSTQQTWTGAEQGRGPSAGRPGLMDQAREGAINRLDQQRERAATGLESMVDALRQSGRDLQSNNTTVAGYVDTFATQVERLASGLHEKDMRQMMNDLERFARRRPGIFLGSAFVIGLAAARFLKSSSRPEDSWRTSASSRGYSPTGYRPSTGYQGG